MTTKTTNTAPLRFIDANILFLNPENPRSDMGDLSELVASIQAHGISPKGKGAKVNAERFEQVTGWTGASNEHTRDAAMVAYPYRNAK